MTPGIRKAAVTALALLCIFLGLQYILPLIFPFILGLLLALAAEPAVRFLSQRLHLGRGLSAGIGVSLSFCFLAFLILLLCGLILRELRVLAGILPELEGTIRGGMDSLSGWALSLAGRAPDGIRPLLTRNVTAFFSDGSALLDRATDWLLKLASGFLSHVPDSALSLGTAIISSFMFSAKLPKIKAFCRSRLPMDRLQGILAAFRRMKTALWGWMKAQMKLSGVTFALICGGFLLLRIPHALLWALLVALVDAFPVLGVGAALIPWSLISFLQGDRMQAFGLLGLYATAALVRSVLEPRLVGRQLGLDPLVTLGALYVGYKLFGLLGMLLAPMLAVTVAQLLELSPGSA